MIIHPLQVLRGALVCAHLGLVLVAVRWCRDRWRAKAAYYFLGIMSVTALAVGGAFVADYGLHLNDRVRGLVDRAAEVLYVASFLSLVALGSSGLEDK